MVDLSPLFTLLGQGQMPQGEEQLRALKAAWRSGAAIPRTADKTVTPMAGARVDLEDQTKRD